MHYLGQPKAYAHAGAFDPTTGTVGPSGPIQSTPEEAVIAYKAVTQLAPPTNGSAPFDQQPFTPPFMPPVEPPWYKRPSTWIIIGSVVVGGAVLLWPK